MRMILDGPLAHDVLRLYQNGETPQRIIDIKGLNCTDPTLRKWLQEQGVVLRTRKEVKDKRSPKVCRACDNEFIPNSPRQLTCWNCTPDKSWMHRYRRYGITKPQYDELFAKQEGQCALCLEDLQEDINTTIDHCHDSLKVRGILCRGCNMVLARLEDPKFVMRAIAYLNEGR